jgi:hypothetical protein
MYHWRQGQSQTRRAMKTCLGLRSTAAALVLVACWCLASGQEVAQEGLDWIVHDAADSQQANDDIPDRAHWVVAPAPEDTAQAPEQQHVHARSLITDEELVWRSGGVGTE